MIGKRSEVDFLSCYTIFKIYKGFYVFTIGASYYGSFENILFKLNSIQCLSKRD